MHPTLERILRRNTSNPDFNNPLLYFPREILLLILIKLDIIDMERLARVDKKTHQTLIEEFDIVWEDKLLARPRDTTISLRNWFKSNPQYRVEQYKYQGAMKNFVTKLPEIQKKLEEDFSSGAAALSTLYQLLIEQRILTVEEIERNRNKLDLLIHGLQSLYSVMVVINRNSINWLLNLLKYANDNYNREKRLHNFFDALITLHKNSVLGEWVNLENITFCLKTGQDVPEYEPEVLATTLTLFIQQPVSPLIDINQLLAFAKKHGTNAAYNLIILLKNPATARSYCANKSNSKIIIVNIAIRQLPSVVKQLLEQLKCIENTPNLAAMISTEELLMFTNKHNSSPQCFIEQFVEVLIFIQTHTKDADLLTRFKNYFFNDPTSPTVEQTEDYLTVLSMLDPVKPLLTVEETLTFIEVQHSCRKLLNYCKLLSAITQVADPQTFISLIQNVSLAKSDQTINDIVKYINVFQQQGMLDLVGIKRILKFTLRFIHPQHEELLQLFCETLLALHEQKKLDQFNLLISYIDRIQSEEAEFDRSYAREIITILKRFSGHVELTHTLVELALSNQVNITNISILSGVFSTLSTVNLLENFYQKIIDHFKEAEIFTLLHCKSVLDQLQAENWVNEKQINSLLAVSANLPTNTIELLPIASAMYKILINSNIQVMDFPDIIVALKDINNPFSHIHKLTDSIKLATEKRLVHSQTDINHVIQLTCNPNISINALLDLYTQLACIPVSDQDRCIIYCQFFELANIDFDKTNAVVRFIGTTCTEFNIRLLPDITAYLQQHTAAETITYTKFLNKLTLHGLIDSITLKQIKHIPNESLCNTYVSTLVQCSDLLKGNLLPLAIFEKVLLTGQTTELQKLAQLLKQAPALVTSKQCSWQSLAFNLNNSSIDATCKQFNIDLNVSSATDTDTKVEKNEQQLLATRQFQPA